MLVHLPPAKLHLRPLQCPLQSRILRLTCRPIQFQLHSPSQRRPGYISHSVPLLQYQYFLRCKFSNLRESLWFTTATRIVGVGSGRTAPLLMSTTLNDTIEAWTGILHATCVVTKIAGRTAAPNAT
jgi:hypothetical protein